MAAQKWGKPPPRHAANGSLNCHELASRDNSDHKPSAPNLKELPSRVALARRWPGLRINRLTWRWRDDASGARGEDLGSLLVFLNEGGRAR